MKLILIILLIVACGNYAHSQQSTPEQVQMESNQAQGDQNSKSITLLTIAISAMATFITALLVYIKKMHSKQVQLATKFVEATMSMVAMSDKLSTSIDNSGEKVTRALENNERTVTDLHKYILSVSTMKK